MIIYKVTNKTTGKMYIGQTTQSLPERWWQHCNRCPSQTHRSYIYNAIQQYGENDFIVEEIDTAESLEELNIKEQTYIKVFKTLAPNGYNLQPGGKGKQCHEDTKAKISQTLKGRPFKNRYTGGNKAPRTKAQKEHLSRLNKGKPNIALYKKVLCVETGTIYESVNACAAAFGINRVTISKLIKSGKPTKNGLTFKFV